MLTFFTITRPERSQGTQLLQVPPFSVNTITSQRADSGLSIPSSFRYIRFLNNFMYWVELQNMFRILLSCFNIFEVTKELAKSLHVSSSHCIVESHTGRKLQYQVWTCWIKVTDHWLLMVLILVYSKVQVWIYHFQGWEFLNTILSF